MRPTILKVEHCESAVVMSTSSGPLITLKHSDAAAQPVLESLGKLRDTVGRSPFFVMALTSPNEDGGHDFVPTFQRALSEDEEPSW